jgi:hypothetical protein
MSRFSRAAAMVAALLFGSGAAYTAQAADPAFCHQYAQQAVIQFNRSLAHHRCGRMIVAQRVADGRSQADDAMRWSPDLRHHYDWCRSVNPDKARSEGIGRQDILVACERH